MNYKGSCHSGQISFEVEGNLEQAMECNCSHCSRKGYLLWFVPRTQFKLLTPEEGLSTYIFNKHVIKHRFAQNAAVLLSHPAKTVRGQQRQPSMCVCLEGVELSSLKKCRLMGARFKATYAQQIVQPGCTKAAHRYCVRTSERSAKPMIGGYDAK